jgi:hypothetical protein
MSRATPPAPSTAELDERYEFERHMSNRGEAVNYIGDGLYSSGFVQDQWDAWCARAALATKPAAPHAKGYVLVPVSATEAITVAIEREIDNQLVASCINPGDMFRQDGEYVWDAALAAVQSRGAPAGGEDSASG